MTNCDLVIEQLENHRAAALEALMALLSIPTVAADTAYGPWLEQGARWLATALEDCGLEAQVVTTPGHPIVFATTPQHALLPEAKTGPHVMFYGHYDVVPPDPVELWTSPPFEPAVRDGAVFARGATDDKGQVMMFLQALHAWHRTHEGRLPCRLTVVIEGEEEISSPNLPGFFQSHRDLFHDADVCLVCDTGMLDEHTVGVTTSLRGLLNFELTLIGPDRDVHSGNHGGTLNNPANALARTLALLWDQDNRVTIPGFYDDVLPMSDEDRNQLANYGRDAAKILRDLGVDESFGETGYTSHERRYLRPTVDVTGLFAGYQNAGTKAVIPSRAGCKISFRLAPIQNPQRIAASFEQWIHRHTPPGCRWVFHQFPGCAWPALLPRDSPFIAAARTACRQVTGRDPAMLRAGASIPVVSDIKRILDLDCLMVGFALEGDNLHSPDEHIGLERFHLGCRTLAVLLAELGKLRLDSPA